MTRPGRNVDVELQHLQKLTFKLVPEKKRQGKFKSTPKNKTLLQLIGLLPWIVWIRRAVGEAGGMEEKSVSTTRGH